MVLADIDGPGAERAAAEIGAASSTTVDGRGLDVRDEAAVRALVAEVAARYDGLDLLFNNAGVTLGGPTDELTAAHWNRIIDVNIRGVVNGVLAGYPLMIEQGHGHIINTASGAGLAPPPFVTAYAMTKHAVVGLSTGLRAEAALHGVRVSVLCPGSIDTPILDRAPDADLPATPSAAVTARAYLAAIGQKPVDVVPFARRVVDQVARNRSIIVVPAAAKSLWYLQRLSPAAMDRVGGLIARKVSRELIRPA